MDESFEFFCVRIVFGWGRLCSLEEEVERLKGRKVIFIVDRAVKKFVEEQDFSFDYEVFSDVEPEPEISVVDEIVDQFTFDTVVGVGGGSTLDVAKLTAVAGGEKVKALDLMEKKLPERKCRLILCPTTAGTGSEVTKLAVFKIPGREVKYVFDDESLYADTALVDPKLTISAPPHVTASSGIDALCHAIEAYTSLYSNPVSDMFAERAFRIIPNALREAYANGGNAKARIQMAFASLLAGIAFNSAGTSLGHALGYAHNHIHNSPHGRSVGMTMPYVLQYNAIANLEKHARIARALGEEGKSLRETALKAGIGFAKLLKDVGIPYRLSDVGASDNDVEEITERIFLSEKHVQRNPRIVRKEDVREVVRKSINGLLWEEEY
ncbi:iron-containing alcohol dehydrogenase [Archaeoglobus sp.]